MRNRQIGNFLPLGIVLVSKGASAEQLLFVFPYASNLRPLHPDVSGMSYEDPKTSSLEPPTFTSYCAHEDVGNANERRTIHKFGISEAMMAHLFAVKTESCDERFEIKIDCVRYVGFPLATVHARPDMFNIVFLLNASASRSIVASYQELSKRLALAINGEERRVGYLSRQIQIMLQAHDQVHALPEGQAESPYALVLAKSDLARHLKRVYQDVTECGTVTLHINDWVEVSFCLQPKALSFSGLPPTTLENLEHALQFLRPYHGILVIDDNCETVDASPSVLLLLKYCSPSKSLLDICSDTDLPLSQVFLVVRHLVVWCKAVVIFPLCESNVYAVSPNAVINSQLIEHFSDVFSDFHLPSVLAEFSPPATLGDFTNPTVHHIDQKTLSQRLRLIVWLLRHQLLVQVHTYLYLMPPMSLKCEEGNSTERNERIESMLKESSLDKHIIDSLRHLCHLRTPLLSFPENIEHQLALFLRMTKHLNGEEHIEEIMYRENCDRTMLSRLFDTFGSVLVSAMHQDNFSLSIQSHFHSTY